MQLSRFLNMNPAKVKKKLSSVVEKIFKQLLMINKKISSKLVEEAIGNDLELTSQNLVLECKKQWEEWKRGEPVSGKIKLPKQKNLLRAVANMWCKLLNSQVTPCLS